MSTLMLLTIAGGVFFGGLALWLVLFVIPEWWETRQRLAMWDKQHAEPAQSDAEPKEHATPQPRWDAVYPFRSDYEASRTPKG